jgi:hypothetical protein
LTLRERGTDVKGLRSDRGGEFMGGKLEKFVQERGIK